MCIAAAIGGAALVGGAVSAYGAHEAAGTQAQAANNAAQIGKQEFNTITAQEQPFMQAGYGAQSALNYGLGIGGQGAAGSRGGTGGMGYGSLLAPFTQDTFKQFSPAYQFQQQQGMQGVLNQASTTGSTESGAAQKDLINYNQGLANTAFNNAFNQYQTQQEYLSRLAGSLSWAERCREYRPAGDRSRRQYRSERNQCWLRASRGTSGSSQCLEWCVESIILHTLADG
jgi:hypothetical protein